MMGGEWFLIALLFGLVYVEETDHKIIHLLTNLLYKSLQVADCYLSTSGQ